MSIHKAERKAVPALISIAGPSSSGKTMSSLLLASGLCPEGKRIGFIDTEKGRGEHYADNPLIKANLPNGYYVRSLDEPFSPDRYVQALLEFRAANDFGTVIIDSATHEWEGFGGCADIAENNKLGGVPNWAMSKKEHKRFMQVSTTMPFDIIFNLRAREKTEVTKVYENGKQKMVFNDLGMQPVQEKNFKFEMLISCMLDPYTKFPIGDSDFHKVPDDLRDIFQPGRYISREDGLKLRRWIDGGKTINTTIRSLEGDFRVASNNGLEGLQKFWKTLSPAQQKVLEPIKEECKEIAAEADRQFKESDAGAQVSEGPKPVQKSLIKPEVKNDKAQDATKTGEAKPVAAQDSKPAAGSGKAEVASNGGHGNKQEPAAKPVAKPEPAKPAVQAQPKPAPVEAVARKEPEAEIIPDQDDVPPAEIDEAHQNAQEIADALTEEEDEAAPVVNDEEEIELL